MSRTKRRKTNAGFAISNFAVEEAGEGDSDEDDAVAEKGFAQHERQIENRRNFYPESRNSFPSVVERLKQKYTNEYNTMRDDLSSTTNTNQRFSNLTVNRRRNRYEMEVNDEDSEYNRNNTSSNKRNIIQQNYSSYTSEQLLPVVSDHLWLVKCIQGRERNAVLQLMQKYYKYSNTPKKLYIKTAFTTDMNIGYIYVEASKEVHVRTAISDISGLFSWKIRLVPQNELVSCLTIKNTGPQVKEGEWCRLTQGRYKNDLGQVLHVFDQGSQVIVRLVPRIDYGQLQGHEHGRSNASGGRYNKFRNIGGRPPKKLFNINSMVELGEVVEPLTFDKMYFCRVRKWRGRRFRKGYILQMAPVSRVDFDITATAEEVSMLRQKVDDEDNDSESDEDLFLNVPPPILQQVCKFSRGDTVKVITGAMINLIGQVITTQPNPINGKITVTIDPQHQDLNEPIMFPAEELNKYFTIGGHVKVVRGEYKDETGLIIFVDEEMNECVLFSDLTAREIRVSINNITETAEVSTGTDVLGNYSLYELISLSRDVVGIIISIQNGQFSILDNKGQIQQCRLSDVTRGTNDRHAVALDVSNSQIHIGDVVIPQLGDYKGQIATVKHIYRAVLFCQSRVCVINAGIFVIRSRLCRLAGGGGSDDNRNTRHMSFADSNIMHKDSRNSIKLRLLARHRASRDPWMNKTIKVIRGAWKGSYGIVKSCNDQKLRIELAAKMKTIELNREQVRVTNIDGTEVTRDNYGQDYKKRENYRNQRDRNRSTDDMDDNTSNVYNSFERGGNAETPLIGTQTPAYPSNEEYDGRTPALGANTPAYGNSTPGYGGMTPAYGANTNNSVWNVGAMTPAVQQQTMDDGGNQTPYSHAHTSVIYDNSSAHGSGREYQNRRSESRSRDLSSASGNYLQSPKGFGGSGSGSGGMHAIDSNLSDSQSASESSTLEKTVSSDPLYFVWRKAVLFYREQKCLVLNFDRNNNTAEVQMLDKNDMLVSSTINIVMSELKICQPNAESRVLVVSGPNQGCEGQLIGIDNDEAIVQIAHNAEVTIIRKSLVVPMM